MFKKFKKCIAFLLVMCLFIQSTNCFVFAEENTSPQAQISQTVSLKTQDGRNFAIPAGLYFIPGIGEVLIEATGAIIVAGVAIEVGSWIYNLIISWFESEEQKESDYKDAKNNGTPTKNHDSGSTDNPGLKGEPRSSRDQKNSDGSVKQRRYYDKNGNADMDIDYNHGGTGHKFPHRHYWEGNNRGPEMPF